MAVCKKEAATETDAFTWQAKVIGFYMLKMKLPGVYRKYARKPVDEKKVVFFEVRLAELTNSFQTLYKAVTAMMHMMCIHIS